MATLLRKSAAAASVAAGIRERSEDSSPVEQDGANVPENFSKVISTGSTLADLAISGGRCEYGGVPGGIVVEIFGPSQSGKTAILSEMSASAQKQGGLVKFADPEARLDQEYTRIYGVNVAERFEYCRPDTVSELFTQEIWGWDTPDNGAIHMFGADSLAALSTNLEMDNDDGDKMGMRRAKEFSEGLRKTCRYIAKKNWLIVCSNQIRTGEGGKTTTPGGNAIPFYASLRMQIKPFFQNAKIERAVKSPGGKEVKKVVGIRSELTIIKSIDDPFRTAPVSIIFGYGVDTIRDELQYYKDMVNETTYNCFNKTYRGMEDAIRHIEENDLRQKLKDRTAELWNDIQKKFKVDRRPKER